MERHIRTMILLEVCQKVEVRFLNDACGGHDPESGEWQDRNLIVDKIKVDGLTVQSEGVLQSIHNPWQVRLDGGEWRMPWQGTLEFNINDAYASHLENTISLMTG